VEPVESARGVLATLEDDDQFHEVSLGADHGGEQRARTANGQTAARYPGKTQKDHCNRP